MDNKIKEQMLELLEASNKLQQEIAGNVWDLFSVANLNSSYVHEIINSSATSNSDVVTIHSKLKEITDRSEHIVENVEGSLNELKNGKNSFSHTSLIIDDFLTGLKQMSTQSGEHGNGFKVVSNEVKKYGCEIVPVMNIIDALSKLIWKQVDGIVTDKQVGTYLSPNFFQDEIVPVTKPYKELDVVMVLHENNIDLRDKNNSVLATETIKQKIALVLG